jgi:hypothetical protein
MRSGCGGAGLVALATLIAACTADKMHVATDFECRTVAVRTVRQRVSIKPDAN